MKAKIDPIRKDLEDYLKQLCEKHKLASITLGTMRYTAETFTATITGKDEGTEKGTTHEKQQLKYWGLPEDLIGTKFPRTSPQGKDITVVGIDIKRRTKPIIVNVNADPTPRICTVDHILTLIKANKNAGV